MSYFCVLLSALPDCLSLGEHLWLLGFFSHPTSLLKLLFNPEFFADCFKV